MTDDADFPGRILIVDDEPANLNILSEILSKDYAVSAVTSGGEALELLRKTPVDLVLLDILMPEMDGIEVCKTIKSDAELEHIPVIFITAMDDHANEEIGLAAGAVDYIPKPIKPQIVRTRVDLQMQNYLYLQFLEMLLEEKDLTIEKLRMETEALLDMVGPQRDDSAE